MIAWALVVYRDGEPVTGPVPADDWTVAAAVAEMLVAWLGGPISVGSAVVSTRPSAEGA